MSAAPAPPEGFELNPPPPGFEVNSPSPKKAKKGGSKPERLKAPAPMVATGEVADGDTFRLKDGNNARIYGADAFEIKQNALISGKDVPIGMQARNALMPFASPDAAIRNAGPPSYGRPVVTLGNDGRDAGRSQIEAGMAVPVPHFMQNDPERLKDYVGAQRSAIGAERGAYAGQYQDPAAYRKQGDAAPKSGKIKMTPEQYTQFGRLMRNPKTTPEQLDAFAARHGRALGNAPELLSFMRRNPRAIVNDYWQQEDVQGEPVVKDGQNVAVRHLGALNEGIADTLGAPVDLVNMGLTAVGVPTSEKPFLGSEFIREGMHSVGIGQTDESYAPRSTVEQYTQAGARGVGQAALPIGGTIAAGSRLALRAPSLATTASVPRQAVRGTLVDAAKVPAVTVATELGGNVGANVAGEAANEFAPGNPYAQVAAQTIGALVGGGGGYVATRPKSKAIDIPADIPPPPPGFELAPDSVGHPDVAPPIGAELGSSAAAGPIMDDMPPLPEGFQIDARKSASAPIVVDGDSLRRLSEVGDGVDMGKAGTTLRQYADDALTNGQPVTLHVDGKTINITAPGLVDDAGQSWGAMPILADATGRNRLEIGETVALNNTGLETPAVTSEAVRRPDVIDVSAPRPVGQTLTPAQMEAMAQNVSPSDMLPIMSNEVGSVDELAQANAGQYSQIKPVDESSVLSPHRLPTASGSTAPKRGPVDLVTFLRSQGGMQNQAGELDGFTNAARDMDFARGEQRFGPVINERGLALDDAAQRAWEAGYFPDLPERPTMAQFLDAVDDTYRGTRRAFLPDDYAEIDAFEQARTTREQVERSPVPLYRDEGQPISLNDLEANAPPVQAYEDWPAGGPDFAGNINLKKLESPQDISRALAQTENRVGFDAATRGRITHAETQMLANELGMTPDALLTRRKGQALNAEEALAARQILAKSGNELVNMARKVKQLENPGDEVLAEFQEAWVRHAAIQEQVAGMTAEAGRTLQQFRMMANAKNVNGAVLAGIAKRGGGPERIKEAAETLLDAHETTPGQFNTLARDSLKPKFKDKLIELWYNSLLSGPQTHVVNITSNTLTALGQLPEHLTAAVIGKGRAMATRKQVDRVLFSEVGARAIGLMAGTREGLAQAARAFKTGEPSDFVTKVEAQAQKAISGIKGEVIRIPTRALTAEDELFKAMARRMELHGLAVREAGKEGLKGAAARKRAAALVADPTDEMMERALDYGRYLTFQRPLGPAASKVAAFTEAMPIAKLVLPFVRTPTNLIKFSIERSPFAPLLKEWRSDFAAKGPRRDLAIAKSVVGTGLGLAIAEMAANGLITGGPPTDRGRESMLRANGWQPYSFKVDDKYYSYSRLDPFSTTIGVAADMATKYEGLSESQREDAAVMVVTSIMANLSNKTWLSGIADMMEAINDPQRYAKGFGKRMVGSLAVPTGINQIARTMDPVARQRDGYGDAVLNRIPGQSDNLYPTRNVLGETIVSEGGVGPDILSPIWESTDRNDPVLNALIKARININKPKRDDMPAKDWDAYQELIGKNAKPALAALVLHPAWEGLQPGEQLKAVRSVMKTARADAKAELFGGKVPKGPPLTIAPDVPSPIGKAKAATDVDPNDIYGRLMSAIPGMTATSGFRDEAYQADMRRRGYTPATNSGHLDGSSLDLKPPPGRSMGWLKREVLRVEPKARALIEGDHLHTTFPGWFGAPVLGNAKAAGLVNPHRGAPPPPPGFEIVRQ